jgi:hypothetical protein
MNIVMAMAMEVAGAGMDMLTVDLSKGTASNWSFSMISKDGINKTFYTWIVFKSGGQFVAMQDSSTDSTDYGDKFLNNVNWVNSDVIGGKVKGNAEFMNFLNLNKDAMSFKYLILTYSAESEFPEGFTWMSIAVTSTEEAAACAYQAETGKNLTCEINGVVGIKEMQKAFANHFPNPATGIINFNTNLIGDANIKVFDNFGTLVKSTNLEINNNFQLNLSELSNGFYNVVVTTPNGTFSKKVIIAK